MSTNPHPTIRALAGATTPTEINPASTALLVIDFQNEYFTGRMPIPDGEAALKNAQRLISHADAARIPVFQIQHALPAGAPVFATDGETVGFHPQMQPRERDTVVRKDTVSVFAGTDIDRQLKERKIDTLIIAGLMTHCCIAGAARDAVPLGYNVIVASDASATREVQRENGKSIDKDALHLGALATIEDAFGDVLTTDEIVAIPVR